MMAQQLPACTPGGLTAKQLNRIHPSLVLSFTPMLSLLWKKAYYEVQAAVSVAPTTQDRLCDCILNSGSKRRTRRWPSSSDWSWCLWRKNSKWHKVSDHIWRKKSIRGNFHSVTISVFPSLFLYDKILQSPRDKSWRCLPTNHPSPSQEWPSLKIAVEPPSVPSCNKPRPLDDPVSETTHSHHTTKSYITSCDSDNLSSSSRNCSGISLWFQPRIWKLFPIQFLSEWRKEGKEL